MQSAMMNVHLLQSTMMGIEERPFRHPLPKLPRPDRQRLGLFLCPALCGAASGCANHCWVM